MLTKDQFEREKLYQISLAIVKSMLQQEMITMENCKSIGIFLRNQYNPVFGSLSP